MAVRTYKKGASWKSDVLLAAPAGERLMSGGNRITAGKPISRETLFATINNSLTVSACAFIIADRRQNCKQNVSTEIVTNSANTTRPRETGDQWSPLRTQAKRSGRDLKRLVYVLPRSENRRCGQCLHWPRAQSTGLCRSLIRVSSSSIA